MIRPRFWIALASLMAISLADGDNFCYSCESTNGSLPDCDALDPDIELYLVRCTGGYCTKTSRFSNGAQFYTLRTCNVDNNYGDFQCSFISGTVGYDEIYCECDGNYCNEAAPRWRRPRWRQSLPFVVLAVTSSLAISRAGPI